MRSLRTGSFLVLLLSAFLVASVSATSSEVCPSKFFYDRPDRPGQKFTEQKELSSFDLFQLNVYSLSYFLLLNLVFNFWETSFS